MKCVFSSKKTILQPSSKPRQGTFGVPSKQNTTVGAPSRMPMATNDKENSEPSTMKAPQKPITEKKEKKKESKL